MVVRTFCRNQAVQLCLAFRNNSKLGNIDFFELLWCALSGIYKIVSHAC